MLRIMILELRSARKALMDCLGKGHLGIFVVINCSYILTSESWGRGSGLLENSVSSMSARSWVQLMQIFMTESFL